MTDQSSFAASPRPVHCCAAPYSTKGGGDPTTDGTQSVPNRWVAFGAGGPSSYGDAVTANVALAVLLNGIGVWMVHVVGGGGYNGDHYGRVVVPVPVDGISSGADSRYYVGYALDGGMMSADGFTVKLGPYYSISKGVKGDKEGGTKMTTTMTTTATDTASLLPPPGWNTIEFLIGNAGNDNVDSWAFLRT
jgi:hypothetical protein